jgi:hypothetical protein
VTGGWRKLHNDEFHNLYYVPNIIRMIKSRKMGGECTMREMRNSYTILVGKHEGKRPLERPRRRCEDDIKMHLM